MRMSRTYRPPASRNDEYPRRVRTISSRDSASKAVLGRKSDASESCTFRLNSFANHAMAFSAIPDVQPNCQRQILLRSCAPLSLARAWATFGETRRLLADRTEQRADCCVRALQ